LAHGAHLVGEFNNWDRGAAKRDKTFELLLKGLQAV
jgi:hypothetical protein